LNNKNAVTGFAPAKVQLDDLMRAKLGKLDAFVWHDLRRSSKTLMSRGGVRPDVSERVLGHVMPGLQPVYDRYGFLDEKRQALERLAGLIDRIVGSNVVSMDAGVGRLKAKST
jgi:hypothetical protein